MKRNKTQKGITLVALIITIIVLLILAVVAIRAVQGDGIIAHAKNARDNYNDAQIAENGVLSDYLTKIEENLPGGSSGGAAQTITADKLNTVLSTTANTPLLDRYGNKITVPAGFKIVVDNTSDASKSTSYTADTIDVTKGIVIEDGSENQFVWIPVGNIKTSTTDTVGTPITLGRYSWDGSTPTLVQPTNENPVTSEVAISSGSDNYIESQPTSTTKNVKARDINDFYNGSIAKGGYYLGRYEAGKKDNTLVCKANENVYSEVTQSEASNLSQNMYANGYGTGTYSSDLVNSYAWDTAIAFIQTFGTETDASTYANQNRSTTVSFAQTGANQKDNKPDKYCNIYDLSGNVQEWTTETFTFDVMPCTLRGGYGSEYTSSTGTYTKDRKTFSTSSNSGMSGCTFRPILYVAINS